MTEEYTEAFAGFILQCQEQYQELERRVDRGEVPAGHGVQIVIDIGPDTINRIRFDRLVAATEDHDG